MFVLNKNKNENEAGDGPFLTLCYNFAKATRLGMFKGHDTKVLHLLQTI